MIILTYHKVGSPVPGEINVPLPIFRAQMAYLAAHYPVLSLPVALAMARAGRLDRDVAVLTFDDGYASVLAHAYPVLRAFHLPALVYVCPQYADAGGLMPWDRERSERVMDWAELRTLTADGLVRCGSHTWSHRVLPGASDADLEAELARSRAAIEDRLGLPAPDFCYPKALWDRRCAAAVSRHYETAVTGGCRKNGPTADPFRLTRIPVVMSDTMELFRAKLEGRLRWDGAVHGPRKLYCRLTGRWPIH